MPLRTLVILLCITLVNTILVFSLFWYRSDIRDTTYNFKRTFYADRISPIERIATLKFNSYFIAGASEEKIFLGNSTSLRSILAVDIVSLDTQHFRITIKNFDKYLKGSYKTVIDPPFFYIMDGTQPVTFRGSTDAWNVEIQYNQSEFYTLALPISPNSFVMRSVSKASGTNVLSKEMHDPYTFASHGELLETQIDGLFCTDGMLLFNKPLNRIIYLYYYRNQFLVMDTSLNLQYRGRTIDPVDTARLSVARIRSDHSSVLATPPLLVNRVSCTYKEWLFVNSNLRAINDDKVWFKEGSVIDVYSLKNGTYSFSFYLPGYKGHKASNFRVFHHSLIALYNKYLVKFKLNEEHFQ
jgi:hypothetical protein